METKGNKGSHHKPVSSMREGDRGNPSTLSHFILSEILLPDLLLMKVHFVADLLLRNSHQILFHNLFTLGC